MGTELQNRAVGEAKTKFGLQLQESVELVLEGKDRKTASGYKGGDTLEDN